mgnify:CR=1 FL=1
MWTEITKPALSIDDPVYAFFIIVPDIGQGDLRQSRDYFLLESMGAAPLRDMALHLREHVCLVNTND